MSRHFVILGAGISGLATGWYLKKGLNPADKLTIIDHADRCGGWIQTIEQEGFLFEQGPRSCRTKGTGRETLSLIEELNLENEVITPHEDANKRYIYHKHQLQPLPNHLWEVPLNPLTQGWLKALWSDWTHPKRGQEDESIAAFFTRRLGSPWMERLIDPFVLGIYAGDCSRLSLKSSFPLFDQWEQEHGSLLRGALCKKREPSSESSFIKSMKKSPLFSFKKGMETFPKALESKLKECIQLQTKIRALLPHPNGITIELVNGTILQADHLISTLPAFALQEFFPALAPHLKTLEYASVSIVNIGFDEPVHPLRGFGYLVPSSYNSPVLGCVWDSCIFSEHNKTPDQTRLTLMLGGRKHPEVQTFSKEELITLSLAALKEQCGIIHKPRVIQIKKAHSAIPQYELGYEKWKKELVNKTKEKTPHLTLSGTAFTGVSINDCIMRARLLAYQSLSSP